MSGTSYLHYANWKAVQGQWEHFLLTAVVLFLVEDGGLGENEVAQFVLREGSSLTHQPLQT